MVGHKFVQVVVQGIRMDKVGYKFQASKHHPKLKFRTTGRLWGDG